MAELRRQIHYRAKGSMGNDEDWWTLVFNPEERRLYVEHEWDHVPLSGGKASQGNQISGLMNSSVKATTAKSTVS